MPSLTPIGTPFLELPTLDSTNNYAMGLVHAGMAQHGMAVFAHEQVKGKGQRNRHWVSESGKNIALSLVIEPGDLSGLPPFYLSMAMAIATRNFIESYLVENVTIKWPNDIYWCDRKAAGILIENVWKGGEWRFAVAGIGININQTDFEGLQSRAVSLKQVAGRHFNPLELARQLCQEAEIQYRKLITSPEQISGIYKSQLYRINQNVRFRKGSRVFEALVKDVTEEGKLVVFHGMEELFAVGEVEWIG